MELVEIDGPVVYLRLQGACGSCPSSMSTMTMGIKRRLQEKIPVCILHCSLLSLLTSLGEFHRSCMLLHQSCNSADDQETGAVYCCCTCAGILVT